MKSRNNLKEKICREFNNDVAREVRLLGSKMRTGHNVVITQLDITFHERNNYNNGN